MARKINLLTENHNALPRHFIMALRFVDGGLHGHNGALLLVRAIWKCLQHMVQIKHVQIGKYGLASF